MEDQGSFLNVLLIQDVGIDINNAKCFLMILFKHNHVCKIIIIKLKIFQQCSMFYQINLIFISEIQTQTKNLYFQTLLMEVTLKKIRHF